MPDVRSIDAARLRAKMDELRARFGLREAPDEMVRALAEMALSFVDSTASASWREKS